MMMTGDLQFNMFCKTMGEWVVLPIYTNCSGSVIGQMSRHVETAAMLKAAKQHDCSSLVKWLCWKLAHHAWWTQSLWCYWVVTGSYTGRDKVIFSSQIHPDQFWGPPSLLFCDYWGSFLAKSGRGVKLTTHLHLVPRLLMTGAITLLPLLAFMTWTGTNLFLCVCTRACA
jgi:hypothetical protein